MKVKMKQHNGQLIQDGYFSPSGLFINTRNVNKHEQRPFGSEPIPPPLPIDELLPPWFGHKKRMEFFPEAIPMTLNVDLPFYMMAIVYSNVWDKGRTLVCMYLRSQIGPSNYAFWWIKNTTLQSILAAAINTPQYIPDSTTPVVDFPPKITGQKEDDVFVVQDIIGMKFNPINGKRYYKIRWQGYPPKRDTWEPVGNLINHRQIDLFEMDRKFGNGEPWEKM